MMVVRNPVHFSLLCLVAMSNYGAASAIPLHNRPPPAANNIVRRATFQQDTCSQDQLSVMQTALSNCADLANKAADFALSGDAKYMQSYFGSSDQQIRQKVSDNYRVIANDCSTAGGGGRGGGGGNTVGSTGGPTTGGQLGGDANSPSPGGSQGGGSNTGSPGPPAGNYPYNPYSGNSNGGFPPQSNYPYDPSSGSQGGQEPYSGAGSSDPNGGNSLYNNFPWFRRLRRSATPSPHPQSPNTDPYGQTPYDSSMLSPITNGVSDTVFLCNFPQSTATMSAQQNPCLNSNALAYTALGLHPVTINPCTSFYSLDDLPTSCMTMDKATTLIHEISHAVFGTRDEEVQQGTIKVNHSYAYNYFAHAIALKCLDNRPEGPGYGITSDH